jgi:Docking domain of Afi1 for Arf3 in vesicle trafficking/Stabilization of polarity axis
VEYILVASFDIDKGPVMEQHYPNAVTSNESSIAELMLPDQAHSRNQDWTIFFLHKDPSAEQEQELKKERARDRAERKRIKAAEKADGGDSSPDGVGDKDEDDSGSGSEEDSDDEGVFDGSDTPLTYVLNLVNTKYDTSVKRGAVVKAMAICTRHSFLHIYKPLLLLALEEYFKSPKIETLAALYHAVNDMDLSLMPRLTLFERLILQSSDNKDMFAEKFEEMVEQRMLEEKENNRKSLENSGDAQTDDAAKPNSDLAIRNRTGRYVVPRDSHEFESRVLYNSIPIPIKVPVAISPETVGDFSIIKLIQTFSVPHKQDPQPFKLHEHLTTNGAYTHPVIVLVNALLTQKRVIFIGNNRPSGEVAEAVLAACALASGGVLRGFTRHAFPYTDLTKIEGLLFVDGFIAGVTNAIFEMHTEWWDLLCDITTGRMKISPKVAAAPITDGMTSFHQTAAAAGISVTPHGQNGAGSDPTGDLAFMSGVLESIASRHGESVIRAKWRDWVIKFTRVSAAFEEAVYGASTLFFGGQEADSGVSGVKGHGYVWRDDVSKQREMLAGVSRIEGWRNTRSYYYYIQVRSRLSILFPLSHLTIG